MVASFRNLPGESGVKSYGGWPMHLAIQIGAIVTMLTSAAVAEMPRIVISPDGRGFLEAGTGKSFRPWGFNYDHDAAGRLLEDYWDNEWSTVVEDLAEMQKLGANVARIHLQFGKFMDSATQARPAALQKLTDLLAEAEKLGLYVDLTGLGCYHKADVPAWYDKLDEAGRWEAQVEFWKAVAATCAKSPAIFCYDLMNEPVVAAGDGGGDWLGPAFGGKHFVQYITLTQRGRPRYEIAQAWIAKLVDAIRQHDKQALIAVGLVPWSLDRPGITSGFVPEKIVSKLDFVAVHLYPQTGKTEQDMDTLRGFAVGKPVIIEETFPLGCKLEELEQFMLDARPTAAGWIGFYWGKTPQQYQPDKSLADAVTQAWLQLFERLTPKMRDAEAIKSSN